MSELPKYCCDCGNKLIEVRDYAYRHKHYFYPDGFGARYSKYSTQTGEKQIAIFLQCPNFGKGFLQRHVSVLKNKEELEY